jgi:hypothetical protein
MMKHFVVYLFPGVFMSEPETKEIPICDPALALAVMPKGAYAFYFINRDEELFGTYCWHGKCDNRSGTFYAGGKVFEEDEIPAEAQDLSYEDHRRAVLARDGNYYRFQRGDCVI